MLQSRNNFNGFKKRKKEEYNRSVCSDDMKDQSVKGLHLNDSGSKLLAKNF